MVDLTSNPDWSMAIWHPQLAAAPRTDGMLAMAVASDFAAADQMFIPDWPLHWLHSVHNLYRYTGDRDLVAELLVPAERMMRWFESYLGDDGLLHDVSGWALIDWASVYVSGCSSIINGLWARALEELAEIARWLGNEGTAAWADRRYEGVKAGFEVFWDEGRGSYVDHVVDGVVRRPMSQHGGATALAAGLVPADRVDRVLDRILDRSRLLRHSWVMYPSTPDGPDDGHMYVALGYPEPTWDVEEVVIEAEPFFRYVVHDARGPGRTPRPDRRPVPRLEGVPRRRPRVVARVLDRRHQLPRLVVDPDPRPHRAHPRHHAGRAGLRLGAGRAQPRRPRRGPAPPCPRPTARSRSRPTPTAAW